MAAAGIVERVGGISGARSASTSTSAPLARCGTACAIEAGEPEPGERRRQHQVDIVGDEGARRGGSGEAGSRAVFDACVEAGGNVVDTADVYSGGERERMLGHFIRERGLRHPLVLATRSGFGTQDGSPHAGGNGAKAIHAALEGALRRRGTDHVICSGSMSGTR